MDVLKHELSNGNGTVVLAPITNSKRIFGVFQIGSAGLPTRSVNSGFFKFTVYRIKGGDYLEVVLRGVSLKFDIGGQLAIQPGDEFSMKVEPNRKSSEAIIAFDYVTRSDD